MLPLKKWWIFSYGKKIRNSFQPFGYPSGQREGPVKTGKSRKWTSPWMGANLTKKGKQGF